MTTRNRYAFRVLPGMRRGLASETPLPTRLVSNEEFPPLPQTPEQRRVEALILSEAGPRSHDRSYATSHCARLASSSTRSAGSVASLSARWKLFAASARSPASSCSCPVTACSR